MLLAAYAAIVAWLFFEQATARPHVGHWALLGHLVLCPGLVYQSYRLVRLRRAGREPARPFLARLVTVPLGLLLAAALASWAGAWSLRGLEQAYAPFLARLGAALPEPCRGADTHYRAPGLAAYHQRTGYDRPVARLHHDATRFVLAVHGGSLDIDGSTFYFDSGAGAWRGYHNDDAAGRDAYGRVTAGLAECLLQGSAPSRGG